jgi:hypothetical protein
MTKMLEVFKIVSWTVIAVKKSHFKGYSIFSGVRSVPVTGSGQILDPGKLPDIQHYYGTGTGNTMCNRKIVILMKIYLQ